MKWDLQSKVIPVLQRLLPLLFDCCCPPVLLVQCRLLREFALVCPGGRSWHLSIRACEEALKSAANIRDNVVNVHTPCAPLLWREALQDIIPLLVRLRCASTRVVTDSSKTSTVPLAFPSRGSGRSDDGTSTNSPARQDSEGSDAGAPTASTGLSALLTMLWHPISEVRAGVLLGCRDSLELEGTAVPVLVEEGLLNFLLTRIHQEDEPTLLQMTTSLLCL